MIRPFSTSVLCALCALLCVVPHPLSSAETTSPIKLALYPRAEPEPALKYRLLPAFTEQTRGNAAVYYGKVTAEETRFFSSPDVRDQILQIREILPLEELRGDKVHLPSQGHIEDDLHRGAHCQYCDWQLPIGQVPYYEMMLPEVQEIRQFGRILGARARIQLANSEFDEAIETLQVGYSLGRHAANGETIINGLVGIAICEMMSDQVLEFVQQPDSPNLYWALTKLPTPVIDFTHALDVEAMGLEFSLPSLRDIDTAKETGDEWRDLFHRYAQIVEQIRHRDLPNASSMEKIDELVQQKLPDAKQGLIASGLAAQKVEAMSSHQIATLYSLQTYHRLVDDAIKCFSLPYPQSKLRIDGVIEHIKRDRPEIVPIAEHLLPAILASRSASVRNDRRIALLRVIEALRIYAAEHDGQLPQQLSDITEVPIPEDPVTGLPFQYKREGDKSRLEGPTFREVPLSYEITMVRPK